MTTLGKVPNDYFKLTQLQDLDLLDEPIRDEGLPNAPNMQSPRKSQHQNDSMFFKPR